MEEEEDIDKLFEEFLMALKDLPEEDKLLANLFKSIVAYPAFLVENVLNIT